MLYEDDEDEDDPRLEELIARNARPATEAKWWHVEDDRIEELVRKLSENAEARDRAKSHRLAPKPLRRATWTDSSESLSPVSVADSTQNPGKLTPADALDQMLRRIAANEPRRRSKFGMPEVDKDDDEDQEENDESEEEDRPDKWWHVSDRKIQDLVETLREGNASSNSSSPVSADSPSSRRGMYVRLNTLSRSDPIPCHRTGRRHLAAPKHDDSITVYVHMIDTGTRFGINAHPDLRIGPDQPPPPNRFTEQFGLGACTNGFELKAQSFDYRYRRWAKNPRPNWVPAWTDSVKAQIELTTGVATSRQRLYFNGHIMGIDCTTVRTAGLTNGVEIQVQKIRDPERDMRNPLLACTMKRLGRREESLRQSMQMEATLRNSVVMKPDEGKGKKLLCTMPPWKTQGNPALFGGKDEGAGRDQSTMKPAVPSFGEVQIFRPDIQEQRLQRVRSLPINLLPAAQW